FNECNRSRGDFQDWRPATQGRFPECRIADPRVGARTPERWKPRSQKQGPEPPVQADQATRCRRLAEMKPISVEMPRTHWSRWLAIAGSFWAVTRKDGPETLTAATGLRCASSTGTAM